MAGCRVTYVKGRVRGTGGNDAETTEAREKKVNMGWWKERQRMQEKTKAGGGRRHPESPNQKRFKSDAAERRLPPCHTLWRALCSLVLPTE